MNKLLLSFLRLNGKYAKILLLITMGGILWLWTQGHFDIIEQHLGSEKFTFNVGKTEVSAYIILKGLLSVIVIFWFTALIVAFSDKRVSSIHSMRAANKVLIQKALQIVIYFAAFLITMNILGVDLTSLTVLSGALGIGLGFGLQKIASNFVSGIILLLERSLKPNDLIELDDGTIGYVRKSTSRSTIIETLDGQEVIVPNEDFITKQVTNWTLNNPSTRITINFGVSYDSDIELAQKIALEAVKSHKQCKASPEAACFLDNFGDSSVDFIVYFWINDVNDGFRKTKSDVMFNIWNTLKEHNIEIPFPQRDLHIRSATPLAITEATDKLKDK